MKKIPKEAKQDFPIPVIDHEKVAEIAETYGFGTGKYKEIVENNNMDTSLSFIELTAKRFDKAIFMFYVVGAAFGAIFLSLMALVIYLFATESIALGIIALIPMIMVGVACIFVIKVIGFINAAVGIRGTVGTAVDLSKSFRK